MQTSTTHFTQPGWLLAIALSAGGVLALVTGSGQTSASAREHDAPAVAAADAPDDPHAGLDQAAMAAAGAPDNDGEGRCPRDMPSGPSQGHGAAVASGVHGAAVASGVHGAAVASGVHGAAVAGGVKAGEIPRASGPGARTVAEIKGGAPELAGTRVRVAGRVIRVTTGVLGRNWLHIQDGSGNAAAGTHDLIVTTTASIGAGDEVIVDGVVTKDKDLGSGYRYDTLVEDADVTVRSGAPSLH